ncbi:hypothetical protein N800_04460 [Lysobacter daejeonensis GH1-9]|uniref:Uncharacterized protein n=1 Tax=Lysobacter daejeonensis GH1-9 TaxID=1385517 RepID=A0A0A0EW31_9GAMM|nr:hypothetical protein N800_04460 [Lysobacter daejeonensis GH1-9]
MAGRTIAAAKWSYAGNAIRAVSQFLVGILLARLLGPAAYGTIAIAWIIVGLGKLVSDFGLGAALIQRPDLGERDIRFAFTVQLLIGCGLGLVGVAGAPVIAAYFKDPGAIPVIRVMSLLFVVQAIGQVGTSLLTRGLRFKAIQLAGISTYLLGYLGVGFVLALAGAGVWSLVAAQMVQTISFAIVVMWLAGTRVGLCLQAESTGLFRFGGKVIGANLASWALLNVDSLFVGRALGVTQLGLYNRAMTLVSTPTSTIVASAQPVLFSGCSRLNKDYDRVLPVYLGVTGGIAIVVLPVFLVIAAIPDTVVSAVYGDAWLEAATILTPLALAMPVFALLSVIGPVLMAVDRVELEVRAQWVALLISVPILGLTAHHSLTALGWGVLMSYLVRFVLLAMAIRKATGLTWARWMNAIAPAAALAGIVGTSVYAADRACAISDPHSRLGIDMLVAAVTYALALRALGPTVGRTPVGTLLQARALMPSPLRRWLRISHLA